MPRLSFENCVKISTYPRVVQNTDDNEYFNVEFIVRNKKVKFDVSIRCNKFTLAAASPVFNKQFFGSLKRKREDDAEEGTVEVIKVEDARALPFKTFLKLIFSSKDTELCESIDFSTLFDVLKLADMYCIDDVQAEVIKKIENKGITETNIISAVGNAEQYKHFLPFGSVCENLMTRCCKISMVLWPATQDFFFFCGRNKNKSELLNRLLAKVTNYEVLKEYFATF